MAGVRPSIIPEAEWEVRADEVVEVIMTGGVALFPTDTVYGCGAVATDAGAEKLAALKGRAEGKPFQVLISTIKALDKWDTTVGPAARKLIDAFWPGPMTLVLPVDTTPAPRMLAPAGSIGFRMPDHELCLDLISRCGGIIAATSANPSGRRVARTCHEAIQYFNGQIDILIDGGTLSGSSPSTVVSVRNELVTVLREGVISEEDILQVVD